jgi:hypothetical protein
LLEKIEQAWITGGEDSILSLRLTKNDPAIYEDLIVDLARLFATQLTAVTGIPSLEKVSFANYRVRKSSSDDPNIQCYDFVSKNWTAKAS